MRSDPPLINVAPAALDNSPVHELHALEARLARLRKGDDSACEKALIRAYETLIAEERARLAAAGA